MNLDPKQLRVNRSAFTLSIGCAGLPLREMWTHVVPAVRWWRSGGTERLPKGSAYNEVCSQSVSGGAACAGGTSLFNLLRDLKSGEPIRNPITVFDIGNDCYEIFGGHHRAVAALVADKKVPYILRAFDPMDRVCHVEDAENAYRAVTRAENIKPGESYNPFPGRRAIRSDVGRIKAIYRHVMSMRGSTLLDIGCNDGYFGVTLAAHGFVPTFVEQNKLYCDLVKAKLAATRLPGKVVNKRFHAFSPGRTYDVVLYTDVFYHTVREKGLKAALGELRKVIKLTKKYLILSPGRWDKLIPHGFTERVMWDTVKKEDCAISYLYSDKDRNYGREVYCVTR